MWLLIIPYHNSDKMENIIDRIKKDWQYYDILSFIEEIVIWYNKSFYQDLTGIFNELFEIECVGYRFVNMQITDIINDEEIKEMVLGTIMVLMKILHLKRQNICLYLVLLF